METGVELLFFAAMLHLFGTRFHFGLRFILATLGLGMVVLSRLDDVFFLLAIILVAVLRSSAKDRLRFLAPFALPLLMIAAYLLYNYHSLRVFMPVSGLAKIGRGYRGGVGESLRLLEGWPFFAMDPGAIAFGFGNLFVMVAQMLAPMAIAAAWLLWSRRQETASNPVLQALALGVLFKGSYNFIRVPIGYQGAWYYGASIATADILLACFVSEVLDRWSTASPKSSNTGSPFSWSWLRGPALIVLCLLAFNITATRASQNGMAVTRDTWLEREHLATAIRAVTTAPFLEFQDGELGFGTGLPVISGFGLAADPAAVRAQHEGTYFRLLAERGITVAAASNGYPTAIAGAAQDKAIYPIWGFNRQEIKEYCFQPFWTEPRGNIVLYRILHQPVCPSVAGPSVEPRGNGL